MLQDEILETSMTAEMAFLEQLYDFWILFFTLTILYVLQRCIPRDSLDEHIVIHMVIFTIS